MGFKSYATRHNQLHIRALAVAADFQFGADFFRALAHSGKPPVALSSGMQELRIYAVAIIAHLDPQLVGMIFNYNLPSITVSREPHLVPR